MTFCGTEIASYLFSAIVPTQTVESQKYGGHFKMNSEDIKVFLKAMNFAR